ncbi:MAG: quinone oxidoreductase [Gammaproteobacteria bacterium]|nr:quinone oxidoreductase [Gammaproteobacteria bacterium]MDE2250356.1 quinone oxidoreductase [Gammaproteobacteria bacterium]
MSKAIRLYEHGGADRLRWEDFPVPAPGKGEVLVRHSAIGVNFYDIYVRSGLYPHALPTGLGNEAAGVVAALGAGVRGFRPGDRVAYEGGGGAYAEERVIGADRLVRLPRDISAEQAAAVMLKGLTAWCLLRRVYKVRRGSVILVTAAAGGVGLILCQWARALGATVIGVVGSEAKAALARRNGCRHVVVGYEGMAAKVRAYTKGQGVDVVYDGVGKDTFMAGLDSLKPLQLMVSFGNASGAVPPVSPLELMRRGSLFLTRPTSTDYLRDAATRRRAAQELFSQLRRGRIKVTVGQRYALRDAALAHADLESRRTTGSIVLLP